MRCDLDDLDQFEDHWDVLLAEHDRYVSLCKRACRGRWDLVPELLSEVYIRAPQVSETWDPTVGSLRAHMWSSISLYLFKFMCQREKLMAREGAELTIEKGYTSHVGTTLENIDQVRYIVGSLSEEDQWLLIVRHVYDMGFEAIGEELGCSTTTARKKYRAALARAREASDGRQEGDADLQLVR